MTFYLKTVKILKTLKFWGDLYRWYLEGNICKCKSLILIKYLYDVVLGKIFGTYFLRASNHVKGVKIALDLMGWKYISSNIYLLYR